MSVYMYIFGPVKLELGVIPSGQKKTFNNEHLNLPGKELKVKTVTGLNGQSEWSDPINRLLMSNRSIFMIVQIIFFK